MSLTRTLARYRVTIRARPCCGRHRWSLLDMVEGLARLGLQGAALEAVGLAGKRVELRAEVGTGDVQGVVDRSLAALSAELGASALSFPGELAVVGTGAAPAAEIEQGVDGLRKRGLRVEVARA